MSKDLINRLRAKPCATISPPAIELEAANRIEALEQLLAQRFPNTASDELIAAMRDRVARIRYIDESSRKLLLEAADRIEALARPPEPINLNDHYAITLTEEGAKVYNDYYAELRQQYPKAGFAVVQAGDQLRKSLWGLMQIFGPHIHMGMCPHFENNAITPVGR